MADSRKRNRDGGHIGAKPGRAMRRNIRRKERPKAKPNFEDKTPDRVELHMVWIDGKKVPMRVVYRPERQMGGASQAALFGEVQQQKPETDLISVRKLLGPDYPISDEGILNLLKAGCSPNGAANYIRHSIDGPQAHS